MTDTPLEAANDAVTTAEAVVWGERATNADAFEAAIAGLVRAVEARTREQVAQDIETTAAASKASTLDRPRYERGGFLNDWQWAAQVARNGPEGQR
jgi:metal-dependent amidase/aminoacylase/carboxypeptidase family protein